MVVWEGLTNSWGKNRSEGQRRKERYTHLNAEFQRIVRKAFWSEQCKEIEVNNRMGKTPGVHSDSRPSSQWCHPAISSSVVPFSSCPQSFPPSGSFQMSLLFASGGQSIRVSASASVLPKNTQGWSPLEWTGWISLQSKGLSQVFSNTTVQKHQIFGAQLSSLLALSAIGWFQRGLP